MANKKQYLMFADDGDVYISMEVLDHVFELIMLQQKFYRQRDKATLEECKRREANFIAWYTNVKAKAVH